MTTGIVPSRMDVVKAELQQVAFQKALQEAMPKGADYTRMVRGAITAIQLNPKLLECDPHSLKAEMMTAAQFGFDLSPALGEAYLVPFRDNRRNRTLCKMMTGYKGIVKLAIQSPHVRSVRPVTVYERDEFSYTEGIEPDIKHKPGLGNRGKAVYFYCVVKMHGGDPVFQVWSKEDCLEHARKYSKTFNAPDSRWKDPNTVDAMCLKTVLRATLKYVPISVSDPLAAALKRDDRDDFIDVSGASSGPFLGVNDDDDDDGTQGNDLPPSRAFLKDEIARLLKAVPPSARDHVTVPVDIEECTTSEMVAIAEALKACAQ